MSVPAELGWWKLDDDAANTDVLDASGNGYHGTLAGGDNTEDISVAGQVGKAFNLSGDSVTVPDAVSAALGGAAGVTLVGWFKRTATGSQQALLDLTIESAASKVYADFLADNTIRCGARADSGDSFQSVTTTGTLTDTSEAHHIALAIDIANDAIRIYVDGVAWATTGSPSWTQTTFDGDVGDQSRLFAVTSGGRTIAAVADDARIYDEALTPGQIKRLYNEGYGTDQSLADLYAVNSGIIRPVLQLG